jgi:hypothetical protein
MLTSNRSIPLLILDKDGVLLGVVCPPNKDPGFNEQLIKEMKKLSLVGEHDAKNKSRGSFKIVKHGIQMGAGARVINNIKDDCGCCIDKIFSVQLLAHSLYIEGRLQTGL